MKLPFKIKTVCLVKLLQTKMLKLKLNACKIKIKIRSNVKVIKTKKIRYHVIY